jgi:FkbM family methyltransferase
MKAAIKKLAGALGLRVFRASTMPAGADLCHDLRRFHPSGFDVVVDVGGNVGQSVTLFSQLRPKLILSLEPVPAAFAELERVCRRTPNARCENIAIGATPGTVVMETAGATGQRSRVLAASESGALSVKVDTLDAVAARHQIGVIDLIKIDTEGYELQVLAGATGLLTERRVRFLVAECSFTPGDPHHAHFPALFDLLGGYGMSFLGLYDLAHRDGRLEFCNALFAGTPAPPRSDLARESDA